ncbi:MAG: aminomethyl transferase family protein [Sandaracinaceae bacterium]|nr:aminomethyl transferase family protein [Sandaracinaceae bacterium]
MSATAAGSRALREHVGISRSTQTLPVRVTGADTFTLLEQLCSSDLSVRDGRTLHSLILTPDGTPAADLFVCADDEDALLLVEGMTFAQLSAAAAETPCDDVRLDDLSLTHAVLAADGPYAFELLADVVTPDVLGLPYGSFFAIPGGHCFRAGKTGEYGYLLLLEHRAAERTWQGLQAGLPRFEGAELTLADLDLAALENGFFSLRHAPDASLGPLELQLSWRLSRHNGFRGAAAALHPASHRTVHFVAPHAVPRGAEVTLDGEPVGTVHASALSHVLGAHVGLLHVQKNVAHPGLFLLATADASSVPLATCSVPWLKNRSLYVNPRESRYVGRHERVFPPLVPEPLQQLVHALAEQGLP